MTTLAELQLTPSQYAELQQVDPVLRDAWLTELDNKRSKIRTPVAWFLTAIRTGRMPGATVNPRDAQAITNAENWIRNAGPTYTHADEPLVDRTLFDDHGIIRNCQDEQLKARLLELWRQVAQPAAPMPATTPDLLAATIHDGEPAPFPHTDDAIDWSAE